MLDRLSIESVLGQLQEGVYVVDQARTIIYWNPAAERLTGFCAAEVVGRRCPDDVPRHVDDTGTELCARGCPMLGPLSDGQHRTVQAYVHHKRGHRVPVSASGYAIRDLDGAIIGAIQIFSDATPVRVLEEQVERLSQMAFLDELTRLPNRRYAQMRLEAMLSEFGRYSISFGVLMLDIDHFKTLNDTHGHKAGDRVLAMVSATLARSVRPSDVISRWGGEEFLVLAPHADAKGLTGCAERCRLLVESSGLRSGAEAPYLVATVSIGGTVVTGGDTAESIVARADALMYQSKDAGRNRVTVG
jgi:diguanylate cyclase (GGDEF)-like protein/PAS domain S-box-containing protein